ncbi:MAG TPA: glycoside hydrolase family 18 protein [Terriglobales bacterium]
MKRYNRLAASFATSALVGLACLGGAPPACGQTEGAQKLTKRVVGDYGYWSRTQTPPYSSAQIPFAKLTHINHAGVNFNASGALVVPDGFLEPELLEKAHTAGVRVLLLLGGPFTALEKNSSLQGILVGNLQTFINRYGYDGVDIDWEYPSNATDRQTFLNLMTALREAFPTPSYVISADVAPWGGEGYNFHNVEPLVDYFNIMMYDCAGPWTDDAQLNSAIFWDPHDPQPYECEPGGSVQQAADIYLNTIQVPASKLNMGTPFYGYFYENVTRLWGNCANCGNTVLSENYGTFIKQRINQRGWQTFYDPIALVPYMLRADGSPGFITYDDSFSTFYRVWYSVWQRGLGGTFMWSLDADYDGHSQDLLDSMYNASLKQTP